MATATEWKLRCTTGMHRVVFEDGHYTAPDHDEAAQVLDAIADNESRCVQAARIANQALTTGWVPTLSGPLVKHVQATAITIAERYLATAELPFPAEQMVALRWALPDEVGSMGPCDDRWLIQRELGARKCLGEVHEHVRRCWDASRRGEFSGLGYGLTVRRSGSVAVVALYDAYDRVVLWRTDAHDGSRHNHIIKATACKWGAMATDKRLAQGMQTVMLANFVAGLLAAWRNRDPGTPEDTAKPWRQWRNPPAHSRQPVPHWLQFWAAATKRYANLTCEELNDTSITDRMRATL
jgi:hypothetical protein